MGKPLANSLTPEHMKFWLANTKLSEKEINEWYDDFKEYAKKNDKLDKASFVKFFKKLNHLKSSSDEAIELMFTGIT